MGLARARDQGFATAEHRAGQPVAARLHFVDQCGLVPQRLTRRDLRDAAYTIVALGQPLERIRLPGVARFALGPHERAHQVHQAHADPRCKHIGPYRGQQVPRCPAQAVGIGVHAPGHACQTRDVHREERQVEPAKHQRKAPAGKALAQPMAVVQRRPVINGREQWKHQPANQHIVQMGHHEVAVVCLPVKGQHRQHDPGESAQHKHTMKAQQEQRGRLHTHFALPESANPGEHLHSAGDCHREAGDRRDMQCQRSEACRKHVVHPQQEADGAYRYQRPHNGAVTHQRRTRHDGHHHRHHARCGQKDDVDLRVPEKPEQVLPQQRVTTARRNEKRPVEGALHLQQQGAGNERWKGKDDHQRRDQRRPGEQGHAHQGHARCACEQDANDQLDGPGNGRNLDEADAQ